VDGVVARSTGYHGEMAINPTTGAIGRLAIGADLKHAAGILRADMLVEYGPVEIGGQTYVCPVKSVSISVAPLQSSEGSDRSPVPVMLQGLQANQEIAPRTMLNDVVFDEYHVFRSEARMVSGEGETSAASATAGSVAGTDRANQSPEANSQAEIARAESSTSPAAAEGNGANSSANSGAVASPAAAVSAESLSPEISEADAFGIPDAPAATAAAPDAQDKGFTLRLTSRLVDVGVAALDKKGHPVTGLKPQEFEIYDNGRKQTVRFFSRTGSEASAEQGGVSAAGIYSNRRADVADAKPGNETTESSATVLLIDAGSLTAKDLTYARGQVLKFLDKVPASQRIGLYVQNWRGFQVLTEPVSDRALLETKLQNWMPDASDVAQAQEMEERNRQQFDTVLHSDDLKSVNGNVNSGPDTASTVDPQLRDFGANPARDGLLILTGVARHLAATPGHKNLVWVASENVLVNWSGNAVSSDKGSKHLDAVALAAQEALNEAHVSIYPLDASQLETMAVDPSLKNRNIELDPSAVNGPQPQSGGGASGRIEAEMQQDTHTVQPLIQQMAQATGGRVFFRGGSIERDLDSVVDDGRAAYLLGFTPDVPADGQYHALSVKLTTHRNVTLRYRMGYEYDKEPTTLKDRFRQAIWQPLDLNEIGISVRPRPAYTGAALKLSISAGDVALRQQGGRWMDRLDIFVVHRELDGAHARITGRTLQLSLRLATYQSLMESGIPFEQFVQKSDDTASLRIIVVDENSGRMGSITLPAEVLNTAP
jgi:VWFA-related protein